MDFILFSTILFLAIQIGVNLFVLYRATKLLRFKDATWTNAGIALFVALIMFALASLPLLWFDIAGVVGDVLNVVLLFAALTYSIRFVYTMPWKKVVPAAALVFVSAALMIMLGEYLYSIPAFGI